MVIDAGPNNKANEDTLRSERRSARNKHLTEPTLLEMSGNATNRDFARLPDIDSDMIRPRNTYGGAL